MPKHEREVDLAVAATKRRCIDAVERRMFCAGKRHADSAATGVTKRCCRFPHEAEHGPAHAGSPPQCASPFERQCRLEGVHAAIAAVRDEAMAVGGACSENWVSEMLQRAASRASATCGARAPSEGDPGGAPPAGEPPHGCNSVDAEVTAALRDLCYSLLSAQAREHDRQFQAWLERVGGALGVPRWCI